MEDFSVEIILLGAGKVGAPVLSLIEEGSYPFDVVAVAVSDLDKKREGSYNYVSLGEALKELTADVYIDCLPYSKEAADGLLEKLREGKTVITCSKEFVSRHYLEISKEAASLEGYGKAYFNSIPASKHQTDYRFLNLTEKNIHNQDINDMLAFREADGLVTSRFVYQDLTRAHHRTHPNYYTEKLHEVARQKEQIKNELYQISLGDDSLELVAQPCGIDPVLVEKEK